MKLFKYFIPIFYFLHFTAFGQISVTPSQTTAQLLDKLVGAGVTYSNATLTCSNQANGVFTVTSSNLGLNEGIILSSGNATSAVGLASTFGNNIMGWPGDTSLNKLLTTDTTQDACVLEFDFVPTGDTVKFRYIFGSEEYPGYSCGSYNDVFGFFISGPGYTTPKNIALIPNTTIPVAINSTAGYVGTYGTLSNCTGMGSGSPFTQYFVNNSGGTTVAFDGFTKIFTAYASVIACNTYHMKLAIADVGDKSYNSGVFIEGGSLTSNTLSVSPSVTNLSAPVTYCVRGCKNSTVSFKRKKVAGTPLTLKYIISGSAVNGTDYTLIPDSVIIPANDTVANQTIIPLTGVTGTRNVKLYVLSPYNCSSTPLIIDSTEVLIYDSIYLKINTPDTSVCPGVAAQLKVTGDAQFTYSWSPTTGLSSGTIRNPTALPTANTKYTLTATLPSSTCLPVKDDITIGIYAGPSVANHPSNRNICVGNNTNFIVAGTGQGLTYQWQVNAGTGFANISNNSIYSGTTTNTLSLTSPPATMNSYQYRCVLSGTCAPSVNSNAGVLLISTLPTVTGNPANRNICENANATFGITATGNNITYQWQVNTGSGFNPVPNSGVYSGATSNTLSIVGTPLSMNNYQYRCVVSNSCTPAATSGTATLTVKQAPLVTTNPPDRSLCTGVNTTFPITATGESITYQWQVNTGTGFANISNTGVYSGTTTNTLGLTNVTGSMDGYQYRCIVSGACNPRDTSGIGTLDINFPAAIATQPEDGSVCEQGNMSFGIGVTGDGVTYQWQVNTGSGFTNVTNGSRYQGASAPTLDIFTVPFSMNNYQYRCIAAATCGSPVTSDTAIMTVQLLPVITVQPHDTTVCPGDTAGFKVTATGSDLSYQWQVNTGSGFSYLGDNTVYTGTGTNALTIFTAAGMDNYQYRCIVSGVCSPEDISDVHTLHFYEVPDITDQPDNVTVCPGDNTSFGIAADGYDLAYQWQVNSGSGFSNISNNTLYAGANDDTLKLTNVPLSVRNYQYRCIVAGGCTPSDTSASAMLMLYDQPAITSQPPNRIVCEGQSTTMSVAATGTTLTYQWQVNTGSGFNNLGNGGAYSNVTTNTLGIANASASLNGNTYRCIVSGLCEPDASSDAALLTVNTLPDVTTDPEDSTICAGGNASFTTTATGTALIYQWQVNTGSGFSNLGNTGVYSGATTNTLLVTAGTVGMSGYIYRCLVSGICTPPATTTQAVLTVNSLPDITSQPVSKTVCENGNTTFAITATGTDIVYQWQENAGTGFANISNNTRYGGATTNTLSLTGVTQAMSGYGYRCVVSGICNPNDTSVTAVLTIDTLPVVVTQPVNDTVCEGQNAGFSVQAIGTGKTYQWQVNSGSGFSNISNNSVYSGATTPALVITSATYSLHNYQYRCVVSGNCTPQAISDPATLVIYTLPAITTPPANQTICEGDNAGFSITATGTEATYQWEVNMGTGYTAINNNTVYSGATTNTLSLTDVPVTMNGYLYRCVVSGACTPPATSAAASLTVYTLPVVTTEPQDDTTCEGSNALFTLTAEGTNLTYQWQVNTGTGFSNISNAGVYSSATTNTLRITAATAAMNDYTYRCIVAGTCLPADISDTVRLTIFTLPAITTQPVNAKVCDNTPAAFTLAATGTNLQYQWQVNTGSGFNDLSNSALYAGTNTNQLAITPANISMSGYKYRCIVSGACVPEVTTNVVVLTVDTLPAVTTQPVDSKICLGNNTSFSIQATGSGRSYIWQVNNGTGYVNATGTPYTGTNTPTLALQLPVAGMTGYTYRCIVSGTCTPPDTSDEALLTIDTLPAVLTQPVNSTICEGQNTSFGITATGTDITYQWQVNTGTGYANIANNSIYSGALTNSLSLTAVPYAMNNYQYRCIVTGLCTPPDTSDAAVLHINTLPTVTVDPADKTICEGSNTSFNITATGTAATYQWQVNDGSGYMDVVNNSMYSGATGSNLSLTAIPATMSGNSYRCIVSGTCTPPDTSAAAILTVNTLPVVTTQPVSDTVCEGGHTAFSITATGTALTYQWQVNSGSGYSNLTNNSLYNGTATNTLNLAGVTTNMSGYQYRCIVSGACAPPATSMVAVLTIDTLPVVTMNPRDSIICEGQDAAFKITAIGTGLTYQWQVDDGGGIYTDISNNATYSGATTPVLSMATVSYGFNNYQYRCIVTGVCAPQAISAPARLTVYTLPLVTADPEDSTICENDNASFTVNATGTNITYQWQANAGSGFTNIGNNTVYSGATAGTLLITAGTAAMNGYLYRCIVSGACTPPDTTAAALLTVHTRPLITAQASASTICEGQNTSFTIAATGTGLTYQWQVDAGSGFADISDNALYSGTATNSLSLTAADFSLNNNQYRCVVSGTCTPQVMSVPALLTIYTLPTITAQPADTAVCPGFAAGFSLAATGTNITYQWQINTGSGFVNISNGSPYSGATTNTLGISSAPSAMNGYTYRCIVSGACTPPDTSDIVTLTIDVPPVITSLPTSTPICEGGNTIFSIKAIGTDLTYQWQVNTGTGYVNITNAGLYSGATTDSLLITGVTGGMNGYLYQCIVSGKCAPSVTSGALTLTLTVYVPPAITGHPTADTICEGQNTSFTVSATGSGITYQWQVNDGSGFSNISNTGVYSGANTPTLQVTGGTANMNGYTYRCVVPGICLPDGVSNAVALTVNTLPNINTQPVNSTICFGNSTSFSIGATGTNIVYQWQANPGTGFVNISNNSLYTGTTTATLDVTTPPAMLTGYQFRCIVSGTCNPPVTSNAVVLTIDTLPAITMQPINDTICEGQNAAYTIAAVGTGIGYQWQVNDGTGFTDVANNAIYAGATTNSLSLTAAPATMDGFAYRCIVSGVCAPPDTSDMVTLTVYTLPVVTLPPVNSTICEGDNTQFVVNATGTHLTYQWQVDNGTGFANIANNSFYSGAADDTLNITAAIAGMSGYTYRCVVSGACTPPATSASASLTVNTLPNITSQPVSSTICEGQNTSFAIAATGTAITYQWQVNDGTGYTNISNNSIYAGATTNTLALTAPPYAMNSYAYRCIVSGTCLPPDTSNAVTLTVNTLPVISTPPANSTICEGDNTNFSIAASGTGITYQWQVDDGSGFANVANGTHYGGATTNTLNIIASVASMSGYSYRCVVTGTCPPAATSGIASLTVNTLPNITTEPLPDTVCEGQSTSYSIVATGTAITYQWQVNNGSGYADIVNNSTYTGATTNSLSVATIPYAMNNYEYRCIVSGTCTPPDTSAAALLTVFTLPVVTANPIDKKICPDSNTTFSVSATGTSLKYQWQVNTGSGFSNLGATPIYSGVDDDTLHITGALLSMSQYRYRCIVSGACLPDAVSNDAKLTVDTLPAITTHPVNTVACENDAVIFTSFASGSGLQWQWMEDDGTGFKPIANNTNYTGVTTDRLMISSASAAMSHYRYACIVAGNCLPIVYSDTVTLIVDTLPHIYLEPVNTAVCPAIDAIFELESIGTNISFQWQENDGSGYRDIAVSAMYTGISSKKLTVLAAPYTMNQYKYRCIVNGKCSPPDTSAEAVLTVYPNPLAIITSMSADTFCLGDSVVLNAYEPGASFQWRRNGENIPGATGWTYTAHTPGVYDVHVQNEHCALIAGSKTVHVNPLPVADISTEDYLLCRNSFLKLTANEEQGSYHQWQLNGRDIERATKLHHNAMYPGAYNTVMTNKYGCKDISDTLYLSIDSLPLPIIWLEGAAQICVDGYKEYLWYHEGQSIYNATFQCHMATKNGSYRIEVTNDNGCRVKSNIIDIQGAYKAPMEIYPNPVTDMIYVNTEDYVHITICTQDGKVLLEERETKSIDIRGIANGSYMMRIYDKDDNTLLKSERIIKISKY